ncbi:hypothetical protein [Ulvibacterium sp.]|uniref:hypothetical protein n=1 Tax=Ulvibacterium sp. TaxID=2665914 RepID=UPI0026345BD4|nr:hypothetical protein [Ulvibacterium sp.]
MKNLKAILGILALGTVLFGCSTVKVSDSWEGIDSADIKNKNVLVVHKSGNTEVRKRFEKDMVDQLRDKGYDARESMVKYPDFDPMKEGNKAEMKKLGNSLVKDGYEIVVLTLLKDIEEYTKTVTSGTTYTINTFPVYHPRRGYHRSFYIGIGNIQVDGAPYESTTSTHKKYILETLVYDLTMTENEQLITIITSEIDNPASLGTTSNDFAKQMVKAMSK